MMKITVLLIGILIGLHSCKNLEDNEYILYYGGTILTVDEKFSEVEAVVIKENKIVETGNFQKLENKYGNTVNHIDLKGNVMLPGFVDAHAHVIAGAAANYLTDYVGMTRFTTTEEVLSYLSEKAINTPEGEWIVARNWDPSVQDGKGALTFEELNSVSTTHPVFVLNASGHLAYANEKAFEVAGISPDIKNPKGAEFVRDKDGNLNGVMKNMTAFGQVWQNNPSLSSYDPVKAIITLLHDWNAVGITTTSELALGAATTSTDDAEILFNASKSEDFTTRIRAYASYIIAEEWEKSRYKPGQGNSLARIVGYKLVADGSNQGFTGLQREPYCCTATHQGSFGIAYTSLEDLFQLAQKRADEGWQLAIHGNGDKGIDNILTVIERLDSLGYDISKLRPRIEHASILHDDQIEKMKELKVSASFLIGHVYYWGTFMRDSVFGVEKVKLLDRVASVENKGISFSLHSDFMVTNPNPLKMIEIAVTRKTWKEPDYKIAPDEAISVESAIRAMTAEAAWQLMSDHETGSIEAGKFADFVILGQDPRKVDPDKISEIPIIQTWMNGKIVFDINN